MFLSNNSSSTTGLNNNNNNNNINCVDQQQPIFDRPFFINDVSPSSKMYSPFPIHDQSFYIDDHQNSSPSDDQDFIASFLQQHQDLHLVGQFSSQLHQQNFSTTISKQTGTATFALNNMEISNCREPEVTAIWNKRKSSATSTSKKDRHSKIVTAQGPRDRRMRLSLEIARRFFNLQDMLGFDKASKTVEWLLTKSKVAIKELTKGSSNNTSGTVSSISECEVASAFDEHNTMDVVEDYHDVNKVQIDDTNTSNPKEKRARVVRKTTFHPPPLAKDTRARARARARERTIEKMRSRSMVPFSHDITQLRANSSSYETGGEESGTKNHDIRSTSLEMMAHEIEDHSTAIARSQSLECQGHPIEEEYSFVIKTSQELNLHNNNNCNFSENWEMGDGGRAHSSYYSMANNMHLSTTDYQFVNKPWIT